MVHVYSNRKSVIYVFLYSFVLPFDVKGLSESVGKRSSRLSIMWPIAGWTDGKFMVHCWKALLRDARIGSIWLNTARSPINLNCLIRFNKPSAVWASFSFSTQRVWSTAGKFPNADLTELSNDNKLVLQAFFIFLVM